MRRLDSFCSNSLEFRRKTTELKKSTHSLRTMASSSVNKVFSTREQINCWSSSVNSGTQGMYFQKLPTAWAVINFDALKKKMKNLGNFLMLFTRQNHNLFSTTFFSQFKSGGYDLQRGAGFQEYIHPCLKVEQGRPELVGSRSYIAVVVCLGGVDNVLNTEELFQGQDRQAGFQNNTQTLKHVKSLSLC